MKKTQGLKPEQVPIGTMVEYHSIISGPVTKTAKITSEVWELGCGELVVKIEGIAGGVRLRALSLPGEITSCPVDVLRDICLLADIQVTQKWIKTLTPDQREELRNFASKIYLKASDNPVRIPKTPVFLTKYFRQKEKIKK